MKLRTRLFLMLLVTSLIPVLIFSTVSVALFVSYSRENVEKANNDKLEIVKSEIDGMLDRYFNTLYTIASQPAVRSFDLKNVKRILADAAKVNPDLMLTLDNSEGDQLVKSSDGGMTNVAQQEFFQQAMSGNESCISDVITAQDTNELVVVIATPVRDMNNNIAGVLEANVYLEQLSKFVSELSNDGSVVYILSRQGTVLAHPDIGYVQNREDFGLLEFVQESIAGGNKTSRTWNIEGEKVIVSHYMDEMSGWLIVVETPVPVAMASAYHLLDISAVILIAAAVFAGMMGLYFSKRFTGPLVELASIIKTMSTGDLKDFDIKIKSKDEIGELYYDLKDMNHNFSELVGNIQRVASTLASHAMQLSSITEETTRSLTQVVTTINEMAQGNSNQAEMVQSTTETIIRINDIISQTTAKTDVAAEKARDSLELAQDGKRAIEQQSQKIAENSRYTNAMGESIQQLAAMTDEIRNIVGVINGIAEQTNLLALNASIEAAHAGDSGRGFAVVAGEIRKLAEQSRISTRKIEDIVTSINDKIEETVNHMNQVKESVLVMDSSAEHTKESFSRIFASITELAKLTGDVSSALDEINNQANEITSQSTNISSVVEEHAAGMQEVSAASEEQLASVETIAQSSVQLDNMAQELLNQVKRFKFE